MKTKKLKKSDVLKARLIKLGCFDEFCENMEKQIKISFEKFVDNKNRKEHSCSDIIGESFIWRDTSQGHEFWKDIYFKINII